MKYLRTRLEGAKYANLGSGFIGSIVAEGGYIHPLEGSRGEGIDRIRITDRFYLGEPQFRGFDIRGVGPRVLRAAYLTAADGTQSVETNRDNIQDDALGGRAYYLARAEIEIPLGAGARELGLRPSIYAQVGSLFGITKPRPTFSYEQAKDAAGALLFNADGSPTLLQNQYKDTAGNLLYIIPEGATGAGTQTICDRGSIDVTTNTCVGTTLNARSLNPNIYQETFLGNSAKPRLSVGIGVNWNSPFGPLRIDLARALLKQKGDDPKLMTFNVGTQF